MDFIDLRSDTVTQPTPAMRAAMASAEVGDDVYGEDPSLNRLQEMAAAMLGKESALFVPSGTMGNLVAVLAHCNRGDEVILGSKAHTFLYEAGGISALGGVHSCQIPNQPDGTLALEDIQAAIRPDDPHHPVTRLISLENTHNRCGGVALSAEYTRAVGDLAGRQEISVHLDGARLFNAAVALGLAARELVAPVDSVTFCLSKGLCAPVGSVLCGSQAFIARAHRIRKQLGGCMRQAGVLAAAGILALETMIDRLAEDHRRAKCLAEALANLPGLILDPGTPATNMIFLNISDEAAGSFAPAGDPADAQRHSPAHRLAQRLAALGIRVGIVGPHRFRLVTHYWIDDVAIERASAGFKEALVSH